MSARLGFRAGLLLLVSSPLPAQVPQLEARLTYAPTVADYDAHREPDRIRGFGLRYRVANSRYAALSLQGFVEESRYWDPPEGTVVGFRPLGIGPALHLLPVPWLDVRGAAFLGWLWRPRGVGTPGGHLLRGYELGVGLRYKGFGIARTLHRGWVEDVPFGVFCFTGPCPQPPPTTARYERRAFEVSYGVTW